MDKKKSGKGDEEEVHVVKRSSGNSLRTAQKTHLEKLMANPV